MAEGTAAADQLRKAIAEAVELEIRHAARTGECRPTKLVDEIMALVEQSKGKTQ